MFQKVFVENHILKNPETEKILQRFSNEKIITIHNHKNLFEGLPRDYALQKQKKNLILADYEGAIIKEAPPAYGFSSLPHYYFIHAKNCIYECQYCFLQGYFNSPDLVFYVNYQKLCSALKASFKDNKQGAWYHAGEFSDSLALSSITGELPHLFDLFKDHPNHFLELRTKSANTRSIMDLKPLKNVFVSFSLSPSKVAKEYDLKASPVKARLSAMKRLTDKGFFLGVHLDPVIYNEDYEEQYIDLINHISENIDSGQIKYISIGTVRFTKDVFNQLQKNYPDSNILKKSFQKGFDGKLRYSKPLRQKMQNDIKKILLQRGFDQKLIYFCMEED